MEVVPFMIGLPQWICRNHLFCTTSRCIFLLKLLHDVPCAHKPVASTMLIINYRQLWLYLFRPSRASRVNIPNSRKHHPPTMKPNYPVKPPFGWWHLPISSTNPPVWRHWLCHGLPIGYSPNLRNESNGCSMYGQNAARKLIETLQTSKKRMT